MAKPVIGGVRIEGLRDVVRDLQAIGVEVADLKAAFGRIAARGAALAASFAPRRSGALASSVKGSKAKNYATIRAGSASRVPYAGAINYGWPARHIAPSLFMQRADEALRPSVADDLTSAINDLIRQKGLS